MKRVLLWTWIGAGVALGSGCAGTAASRTLPKDVYLDKMKGAWVGQMVGVSYGAPYEFRVAGRIDEGEIRPWRPEYIENSIKQDDLYVEMTWLMCLEDHGLDVTFAQAGKAFADTQYPLWHANRRGRENVRRGIMPPESGNPKDNVHANDIDYQIEADAIGIICPALPQESNRLGNIFGHIMNYGDGVYGGLFMQGMYAAAYFENRDAAKVVEAGLGCIPAKSLYARCIRDVLRWHRENPNDWRATWKQVEAKYNDGRDCEPSKAFNIDAHLNGAYVVIGLLYGGDDFWKVCEIATRCGQDSDCNPSSAAGVWGCMRGLSGLPKEAYAGLDAIADKEFLYTRYSFHKLTDVSRKLAEQIIARAGGTVTAEAYQIPAQAPRPAPLEQWESPGERALAKTAYLDKLQGAWVGQMVGVSYGAPYEFRSPGKIDEGEIRSWKAEYIENAIGQDDLYVEMTWLMCLEDHGLDVTFAQAGKAFAATEFGLAHANKVGRANVRKGIMPPASGDPQHSIHCNDIDYQIEADAIGIICPGMPRESNRLGNVFGHIMNYGDGVYGGLFMQGMYCAAYFEDKNVVSVINAGLECIPPESLYARCIRDVLRWHKKNPDNWRAVWKKVEAAYNDDRDCEPGQAFDIDAHLNGAYVVIGLLYGGDDFWKVCEIATRCGQDSDCNPSSAAGVWGCMHGLAAIPKEACAGLEKIADKPFSHTRYSYRGLIESCRKLTEKLVLRCGGRITKDEYWIPVQFAVPGPLEQWENPPPPASTAPAKQKQ
jgi:hypothetical protein